MMEQEELEGRQPIKLPFKAAKVRNKAPAPVQITAEQLLREAKDRELEIIPPPPKQKITDPEELQEFQLRKRKEFEDGIRKNRMSMANWIKYDFVNYEYVIYGYGAQGELQRARSIFERCLDVEHRNIGVWFQYAELEMRNRQVNHARNVWDRAVTLLPRINQIFERWMEWEPPEESWNTYINFELRYKEVERARDIWQRYLHIHHDVKNWIRYARFEERQGNTSAARQVFERAVEFFGDEFLEPSLIIAFAKFEEGQKEHDRARVIYKYALDTLPKEKNEEVFKHFSIHEKKYGERTGIENVIVSKRKHQYEQQIKENSYNYDAWFDYLRLLENEVADVDTVRDTYERAVANIPLEMEKRYWRRYIYLWINYALYEELEVKDWDRTREIYKTCLDLIPHKKFTFAKIWLLFAQFEIRQKELQRCRKILGTAIGKCPKDRLFRGYIDLELQLREFDRCRILYEKYLEFSPENCTTWIKFAELETLLGDTDRARSIYELAIVQPLLDMPEVLWKAYVDFEIGQEEWERARKLYKRLLQRTQHVKVWISCAQFELSTGESDYVEKARNVYRKAHESLVNAQEKEERLMLLESWKQFEEEHGSEQSRKEVEKELPKRVKKRRPIQTEDGQEAGWEEYYDYIFPSDEGVQANLKLLALAKAWKQKRTDDGDSQQTTRGTAQELVQKNVVVSDSDRKSEVVQEDKSPVEDPEEKGIVHK